MGKKKPRKGGDDDWENDVEQMEAGDAPEAEPTKFKGLIFSTPTQPDSSGFGPISGLDWIDFLKITGLINFDEQ